MEWFRKVFIPQAKARSFGEPILLLYDGHGSHLSEEMINLAEEHNIILFRLPPHTTHKLQPLDVGIFGPIQAKWLEIVDRELHKTGKKVHISQVVKLYMEAREAGMRKSTIEKAFLRSGLNPVNPQIFTDVDYAPSKATSRKSQLPSAYPRAVQTASRVPAPLATSGEDDDDDDGESDSDPDRSDHGHDPDDDCDICAAHVLESVDLEEDCNEEDNNSTSQENQTVRIDVEPAMPNITTRMPARTRIAALESCTAELQAQVKALRAQVEHALVHCSLSQQENTRLRHAANTKEHEGRVVDIDAQVVTSAEGRARANAQAEARRTKEAEKADREVAKQTANLEQRQRRMNSGQNMVFTGSIKSMKKADLQDLCWALMLDESGTNDDMKTRTIDYFEANPTLKTSNQFRGLFERTRGQKRAREVIDEGEGREHPPAPPQDLDQMPIDPALRAINISSLGSPALRPPLGNMTNRV